MRATRQGQAAAHGPSAAELARNAARAGRAAPEAGEDDLTAETPEEAKETRKAQLAAAVAAGEGTAPATGPGIVDLDEENAEEESEEEEGKNDLGSSLPAFVVLPDGMKLPKGWIVWAIRFRAKLTNTPKAGDRWCVMWNLTEGDQKRAAKRARGDGSRIIDEMAKQMVRVIGTVGDATKGIEPTGAQANWSGELSAAGSIDAFWNAIGGKYQHALKSLYLKTHTFSAEENRDFFEDCVFARSVG